MAMLVLETTFIVQPPCGVWHWLTGLNKAVSASVIIIIYTRHVGDDKGRTYELEQSAVKCLRGILYCYMRQAKKASSLFHY